MKGKFAKSYRGKLMVSFAAALLVPTLLLSIVYYNLGADSVQTEARRVYSDMLSQVMSTVDDGIEEIENLATVYSSTGWVKTILYMQGNQIDYNRIDVYKLWEYGDVVRRVEATNSIISRSALVFVEKNVAMLNNGLWPLRSMLMSAIRIPNMTVEEAIAYIAQNEGTTYLYPALQDSGVKYPLPPTSEVLSMIIEVPSLEKKKAAQVVVSIELSRLRQMLDGASELPLCIYTQDGQQLAANSSWEPFVGSYTEDEVTINGEKHLLFTTISSRNGWRYVSYVPLRELLGGVRAVRNLLVTVCAALLLFSALLAILLTWHNYKPIKRLSESVRRPSWELDDGKADALDVLEDTYRFMSERSETLDKTVGAFRPLAREAFFSKLVSAAVPAGDVVSLAAMLDVDLQHKFWVAALFTFEPTLVSAVEKRLSQTGGYIVHIESGKLLLVLGGEEGEACVELLRDLSTRIGAPAGIAQPRVDLGEMPDAYMEAGIALEYAANDGAATYEEAVSSRSVEYDYSQETESALVNALRSADFDRVRQLIEEAVEQNRHTSPLSMRCLLYNILSTMLRICRVDRLELDMSADEYRPSRDSDEMKVMLLRMARSVCRAERERAQSKPSAGNEMIAFVRANFRRPEMSLTMLAESFGISSQYASRLYKEASGLNFLDSLMRLRIECAKGLLQNPEITIDEASRQAGFESAASFRRAFKRVEGITPGEWRDGQ